MMLRRIWAFITLIAMSYPVPMAPVAFQVSIGMALCLHFSTLILWATNKRLYQGKNGPSRALKIRTGTAFRT